MKKESKYNLAKNSLELLMRKVEEGTISFSNYRLKCKAEEIFKLVGRDKKKVNHWQKRIDDFRAKYKGTTKKVVIKRKDDWGEIWFEDCEEALND